jgi:hypothetical protein
MYELAHYNITVILTNLVRLLVYVVAISVKLEFSRQIFENTKMSNFKKILSVGAELFHADRQTGRQTRHS